MMFFPIENENNKRANHSRFFYQKKKFQLPQYVPQALSGYVMYGFEEIAQVCVEKYLESR